MKLIEIVKNQDYGNIEWQFIEQNGNNTQKVFWSEIKAFDVKNCQ